MKDSSFYMKGGIKMHSGLSKDVKFVSFLSFYVDEYVKTNNNLSLTEREKDDVIKSLFNNEELWKNIDKTVNETINNCLNFSSDELTEDDITKGELEEDYDMGM